jgi:ferredoxin-nitrite reductase
MDGLAHLADIYGPGELRLTAEQNIIIPNIENSKIEALLKDLLLKDSFSPEPPLLMKLESVGKHALATSFAGKQ